MGAAEETEAAVVAVVSDDSDMATCEDCCLGFWRIMSTAVSFLANIASTTFNLGEPRPPFPLSEFSEFWDVPDKEAVAEVGEVPLPTTMLICKLKS